MGYCFRVCFCSTGEGTITSDAEHVDFVANSTGYQLKFSSGSRGVPIGKNDRFTVSGGPFETEDEALTAAQHVWAALLHRAVVSRRGLDLGQHLLKSFGITEYGRQLIAAELKTEKVEPDHLGITIFTDDPKPTFVRMNAKAIISNTVQSWIDDLSQSVGRYRFSSPKSEIAAGIYSISHFVRQPVARFLLLFISLEAIFEPAPGSERARAHVDQLIANTKTSDLPEDEKDAIASRLSFLRQQSIAQTGREIAKTRLKGKKYMDQAAEEFFRHVYSARNSVVHSADVDLTALQNLLGEMDRFVSDVLTAEYVAL